MQSELQEAITLTTRKLGLLEPSFVEKDFHVTNVLHGMGQLKNDDFELVFIGGTCLTKAHQVVQRMSEDIDFKLVPRESRSLNSRAAREQLSTVRHQIVNLIQETTGLSPKEGQLTKGNNNRFTQIFLDYDAFYPAHNLLRPQIKIELTAQSMLLPAEYLEVSSLIHRTLNNNGITQSQMMLCTSIHETASEKWAALCRRVADADRDHHNPEKSIIRHLYDLCCIEKTKGISADFEQLTPIIVLRDRERFKGKSPHFYEDPLEEIQKGFYSLRDNRHWEDNYKEFVQNMVFQKEPPTFNEAIQELERIHERAIDAVQQSPLFQEQVPYKTVSLSHHTHSTKITEQSAISESVKEKIQEFITLQDKQKELVQEHYVARAGTDPEQSKNARDAALLHLEKLQQRSKEIFEDPEIQLLVTDCQYRFSHQGSLSFEELKNHWLANPNEIKTIRPVLQHLKQTALTSTKLSESQSQQHCAGRKQKR